MKLPFTFVLGPLLRLYFRKANSLCRHVAFSFSLQYTYVLGTLGIVMNAKYLRKHLGKPPVNNSKDILSPYQNSMLVHDLKVIATSIGLIQYICLLIGCVTDNPALFLPHLLVQFIAIVCKLFNAVTFLVPLNVKSIRKLTHVALSVILMSFNWLQEFCVFNGILCICDL